MDERAINSESGGIAINKLMGFYELMDLRIPAVDWKLFDESSELDGDKLWTVRMGVLSGDDLHLPRAIGVTSSEAVDFAKSVKNLYRENAAVIYYPYFIADKTGTLMVRQDGYVIEVADRNGDNVSDGWRELTIIHKNGEVEQYGNAELISDTEIREIEAEERKIRGRLNHYLREGKDILLEWSYAIETDTKGTRMSDPRLVFHKCRTI